MDNCKFHFGLLCSHKCWVPTWLIAHLLKLGKLMFFLAKCKSHFWVRKEENERKQAADLPPSPVFSAAGRKDLWGITWHLRQAAPEAAAE